MGKIKDFMKKMKRKLDNSLFEKQEKIESNLCNYDEIFPSSILNKANKEHRRKAALKQSNQVHVDQNQGILVYVDQNQGNARQNQGVPMNARQNQGVPMNAGQNQRVPMNARQNQGVPMNARQNQGVPMNAVRNQRVPMNARQNLVDSIEYKLFNKDYQEGFKNVVLNDNESEKQGPRRIARVGNDIGTTSQKWVNRENDRGYNPENNTGKKSVNYNSSYYFEQIKKLNNLQ